MFRKSILAIVPVAVLSMLGVTACSSGNDVAVSGDSPVAAGTASTDETCEQFIEVNERYNDADIESMNDEELLANMNAGATEMDEIGEASENLELATAIGTMTEALRTAVVTGEGDMAAVDAAFKEQIQQEDVQQAATTLDETCDAGIGF